MKEINATDKYNELSFALRAKELAFALYKSEEYSEAIEFAECALNYYKKTNDRNSKITLLQLLAYAKYYAGQRTASVEHYEEALKYSLSDLNLYYENAMDTCNCLFYYTGTIRIYCIKFLLLLFKEVIHVIVFADTISADTFSFTSSNDNGKASTDVSLSSDHLEFIQPELAIPVKSLFGDLFEAFFQLFTRLFTSIFNISTVVYATISCALY